MSRKIKPVPFNFKAADVWAATCHAHRVNDGYVRAIGELPLGNTKITETNRQIVERLVKDPSQLTQEDYDEGVLVRTYFQAYTFKILQGAKLSEFDSTALKLADRETIDTNYELALLVSLPGARQRGMVRQSIDQRIAFAEGGVKGQLGEKVSTTIEVLKSTYSQNWGTNYITGITTDNRVVFFALKESLTVGKSVNISGTIKSQLQSATQLNRTKILS
jgi:hypothetical protein